jgi:hypothetical protein
MSAAILGLVVFTGVAAAQSDPPGIPPWAAIVHHLSLRTSQKGHGGQPTGIFPPLIPTHLRNDDPSGVIETYNINAPTHSAKNPFFQSLGTNGRACATCHEPRSSWGVSAESIQQRFANSGGDDPIFRLVDGATCDSDNVSTLDDKRKAYSLLLSKGLIRIFLPLPATQLKSDPPAPRDYEIVSVKDPLWLYRFVLDACGRFDLPAAASLG